jgi:hypothetical protein
LGDGTSAEPEFTTKDSEIVNYLRRYAESLNLLLKTKGNKTNTYRITSDTKYGGVGRNYFKTQLKNYNLVNNKHIPTDFMINSRENRLKLLAGIIDSDGTCSNTTGIDICLKNKILSYNIQFLARSLGFSCNLKKCYKSCTNSKVKNHKDLYYRMYISGSKLKELPLQLKYKIPNNCDSRERKYEMYTSFKIQKVKKRNYCGFETDGNKRFLLKDFTVTHNSTFMKSIGIGVIMAQSGMFVPASTFEYSPYDSLFARITANDNIFKGLSSFALEMTELRAILKRTNSKTLVIGDEVCRGTENISGNSIVAATIIQLAKKKSSFIFASHLHELSKMERIKKLKNVKPYHLTISYNEKTNELIFDRLLISWANLINSLSWMIYFAILIP